MDELMMPVAFGLVAASLAALSIGFAVAWRRSTARVAYTESLLEESDRDRAEMRDATDALRSDVDELNGKLDAARKATETADDAFDSERSDWSAQRDAWSAKEHELRADLQRAREDVHTARHEASVSSRAATEAHRLLGSLGVDLSKKRDPTHPDERMASRAIVRQLLLSSGAEAAAMVDSAGMDVFAAGRDASVQRLGVASAIASAIEPQVSALLCTPVSGMTFVGPRFSQHVLQLHGSDRFVAVENAGEAPLFALRHARLSLLGQLSHPSNTPAMPEHYVDLDHTPDARLGSVLNEWAKRWSAQSVSVIGPDGQPIAATASADAGAAVGLRQHLHPITSRAMRDRMPINSVGLTAWAEDGTCAQVAFVHDDMDTAVIVSVSVAKLPDRALTELQSTTRWHLSTTAQHDREAS